MEEVNYCRDPADVRLIPGTAEALARLKASGFLNIVITNQSGIGRGWISESEYEAVHDELLRQIGSENIDAAYYCPEVPGPNQRRRKPSPEMVLEAARDFGIDLGKSFFVGDKAIDIECGRRAGVSTVLVRTGYGESDCNPDFTAKDIVDAVCFILRKSGA